jgi:hypothetical protein
MKRFIISAVVALLLGVGLAGTSVSGQAATITLLDSTFKKTGSGDTTGTHYVSPTSFTVFHDFGSYNDKFVDTFKFTIANITQLAFDVTTTNHIINMNFQLFGDHGNKLYSQSGFQGQFGDVHNTLITFTDILLDALLTQHFLVLKISGVMCSCASYNIAVTNTPIPPALLLFLTGIVGVGGMGVLRRRNAVNSNIAIAA